MKRWIALPILLVFACLGSIAQTSSKLSLSDFEWLLGKWERLNNRPGQITYESWVKESDTKFTGFGWTMKGKDTLSMEKLSLVVKGNNIYYVADVSENAAPVSFRIMEQSGKSFVSSNPEHDFPKKVAYKLEENGILVAVISDDKREISFRFKKIK